MKRVAVIVLLSIAAMEAWTPLSTRLYAVDKDKGFKVQPADSYASHATQEKITIGVEPYTSEEQQKSAFGKARPAKYGITPVFVVIQNDTGKPLRMDLKAEFVTSDGEHLQAMDPYDVQRFQGIQKRPDSPKRIPYPIPGVGGNKNGPLNVQEIEGRAFAVKLLPPGEEAHGFFYFESTDLHNAKLYLSGIRDAATNQAYFYFELPLDK